MENENNKSLVKVESKEIVDTKFYEDENEKFHKTIKAIFDILDLSGFYLDGRMTIISKKTGKIWK